MKYNIKSKIEKINELESNKKAQAIIESASLQEKTTKKETKKAEKGNKKVYSFSLDQQIVEEIEEFLNDFGERKESKSSFLENSLRFYLNHRKQNIEAELKSKLEKFKNKK
ncbi:MAG: hypothetical protein IJ950_03875 [Helicobacter sp.]|nr:hypothetical protein [Helicobacter sp.]